MDKVNDSERGKDNMLWCAMKIYSSAVRLARNKCLVYSPQPDVVPMFHSSMYVGS